MPEAENIEEKLTEKQKQFCENYVFDWNATRSYLAAYPDSGYDAARSSASDLLTKPNILAFIEQLKTETARLSGVSALRNATELSKMAYTTQSKLRTGWNDLKEWDELTEDEKAAISEIQIEETTRYTQEGGEINEKKIRVRMHDKHKAIDTLNKMLGFNAPEKREHTGKDGEPLVIKGMMIVNE